MPVSDSPWAPTGFGTNTRNIASIFAEEGYCILIHNRDVAEGYRKNFEMMWNLAKEKN